MNASDYAEGDLVQIVRLNKVWPAYGLVIGALATVVATTTATDDRHVRITIRGRTNVELFAPSFIRKLSPLEVLALEAV